MLISLTRPSSRHLNQDLWVWQDIRIAKTCQVLLMCSRAENHWVRPITGKAASLDDRHNPNGSHQGVPEGFVEEWAEKERGQG